MEFKQFKTLLQKRVSLVVKDNNLFTTAVDKDKMWNTYLDSFPKGTNEIFRERREFDCSCCRQFIRSFGNVVAIEGNMVETIWDFETGDEKYQAVADALDVFVKSAKISNVFVTKESGFGTDKNHEQLEDGTVITWEHFRADLPKRLVTKSNKTVESIMGNYRDTKNVFKRSLDEISADAIETVLDLIAQNSLYKGAEWKGSLTKFLSFHKTYHKLTDRVKDNYCWDVSSQIGGALGKIRNHSIGTLLNDLTAGIDLNDAVRKYEKIVAPSNYKRPKALFTKKMVERAQKTVQELGLSNSLGRRFAAIDDITVNNIMFANRDSLKKMNSDVFSELQCSVAVQPKQFDRVEEIPILKFVEEILPRLTNIEVFFENKHEHNLMSVIAPSVKNSPSMFKWSNGFSWAYNGNITDSMKQRVKAAGGNVEGVLRFSLQWNENGDNRNDFDAHCKEPGGSHIFFPNKGKVHPSSGILDVDIIHPKKAHAAVENITWSDISLMKEGIYEFFVHNYTHRGGRSGFSAEIEYDGQIYSYEYNKELKQDEEVNVAKLNFNKRDGITMIKTLPHSSSSKSIWGIDTNQFHPVSVLMFSPNYWDGQKGIGNKHYFFILNGCLNDTQPNGFFNEFLHENLMGHKRVFEALGSKMRVEDSDSQLSGLGFSSTKRGSLVCKVDGHISRTLKLIF